MTTTFIDIFNTWTIFHEVLIALLYKIVILTCMYSRDIDWILLDIFVHRNMFLILSGDPIITIFKLFAIEDVRNDV